LVVLTSPEHTELKEIARQCITKYHAHHYLGFAETQWKLFQKETPPKVKPLLYVYRVLLTGIHLMRTGEVEANLLTLNVDAKLPYVDELVARKLAGPEKCTLGMPDLEFHQREFVRLRALLEDEHKTSTLPEATHATARLSELLVNVRLKRI
jgi:predicted nucleotidyltransferase